MRRFLSLLSCCLALLGSLPAQAEVIDIDNAELARLQKSGIPLIDIRTTPEWEQTGIISGSQLLTFFDERGGASPKDWLQKASAIAKPNQPVILICRTGSRTRIVSQFLSEQVKYAKVYNVKAGIFGWMKEGRAVTPASPVLAACRAEKRC